MILQEGSNQGLLFESNAGSGGDPRVCQWPERGVSFAFWSYLAPLNPAMTTAYNYPKQGRLKNSFVEFVAQGYVVAVREIRYERQSVALTESEMAGYWPLVRNLSVNERLSVDYAQIRIWTPEDQRVFVYGDYLKWSSANIVQ